VPWCPKCKCACQVGVTMTVLGDFDASDDINCYPILEQDAAEPTDIAWCFECEHKAPLIEFKE